MATTVARQIKADFPGAHLTWAIGYKCKQAIDNNPYVDAVWSVEYGLNELPFDVWRRTKLEAQRRQREGHFDRVYYIQLYPDNLHNFDGTTRTSIFRSYPGSITVPVPPVMRLFDQEVENVSRFAERHALRDYRNVVLFECAPASNQSSLTPTIAIRVARRVVAALKDTAFVISTHQPFSSDHPAIIDGSPLTYRENAELSKHCTLLLGCSSGITWLLTSDWAKKLPTIQFLRTGSNWFSFASVKYDHEYLGLDVSHILETSVNDEDGMTDLIERYLQQQTFEGLPSTDFRPSVDQLYNLYRMMHGKVQLGPLWRHFSERNRTVEVSKTEFYLGVARNRLRMEVRDFLRRTASLARRIVGRPS